jgi:hypothetical protein
LKITFAEVSYNITRAFPTQALANLLADRDFIVSARFTYIVAGSMFRDANDKHAL